MPEQSKGRVITVELAPSYTMVLWIVGFCTLGVGALAMYLSVRGWPKEMDDDGITLRNGERIPWAQIKGTTAVTVVGSGGGGRITGRLDLDAGTRKIPIVTQSIVPADAVLALIRGKLGDSSISPG